MGRGERLRGKDWVRPVRSANHSTFQGEVMYCETCKKETPYPYARETDAKVFCCRDHWEQWRAKRNQGDRHASTGGLAHLRQEDGSARPVPVGVHA